MNPTHSAAMWLHPLFEGAPEQVQGVVILLGIVVTLAAVIGIPATIGALIYGRIRPFRIARR